MVFELLLLTPKNRVKTLSWKELGWILDALPDALFDLYLTLLPEYDVSYCLPGMASCYSRRPCSRGPPPLLNIFSSRQFCPCTIYIYATRTHTDDRLSCSYSYVKLQVMEFASHGTDELLYNIWWLDSRMMFLQQQLPVVSSLVFCMKTPCAY